MPLIRVVDFETTGMEAPAAEVCEVGWADFDTESRLISSPSWRLHRVREMPPEVRAIHHILLEQTADKLPWDADEFADSARGAGVVGWATHKREFDVQWLATADLPVLCTYKVALRLWPTAPGHSNQCLRYWLGDQGLVDIEPHLAMPPHRAGPDAYVTAHILKAAFATGTTGRDMFRWSREPALLPTCPIGEHRGKPWAQVPTSFLEWMAFKAKDMDADRKWNAQRELDRRQGGGRD